MGYKTRIQNTKHHNIKSYNYEKNIFNISGHFNRSSI